MALSAIRGPIPQTEDPEYLWERKAIRRLIAHELKVHGQQHGQRRAEMTALAVLESIAEFLTTSLGPAEALSLLEEYVAGLRHQAEGRMLAKPAAGAK